MPSWNRRARHVRAELYACALRESSVEARTDPAERVVYGTGTVACAAPFAPAPISREKKSATDE